VISGNSGAPVLDENQHVVGIVFASSNNKIRNPTDELEIRIKSNSKGFAFTMAYVMKKIGHLL
jgi:V8-like Glu-specific endopeptidase